MNRFFRKSNRRQVVLQTNPVVLRDDSDIGLRLDMRTIGLLAKALADELERRETERADFISALTARPLDDLSDLPAIFR